MFSQVLVFVTSRPRDGPTKLNVVRVLTFIKVSHGSPPFPLLPGRSGSKC